MSIRIRVGKVEIGGGAPIAVQSMTKTRTSDLEATISQVRRLADAGCEIVRVGVPDEESARAISHIKGSVDIPIVADIHFDHRVAIMAIEHGADKIRINPGTIGARWKVEEVVRAARERGIPIRVGANSGSIPPDLRNRYGKVEALVEAVLREVSILEGMGFYSIVVSAKASDVDVSIEAYKELSRRVDYPIHVGITEAGFGIQGIIRSAVGIGAILSSGIGDTVRVSLTGDPVREVEVAYEILSALGLRERRNPLIVSCPACARSEFDVEWMANRIWEELKGEGKGVRVAVMGCAVNGPGEARDSDIGIAGTRSGAVVFVKGRVIRRVKKEEALEAVISELKGR
jgi:(E)-4-hydroxy-3-methylbut-2-enyl-diphosphate synthase